MDALGALRTYTDAVIKSTEMLMSPKGLAELFKRWSNPTDPAAKALLEAANNGDGAALKKFQQTILNTEFGECELRAQPQPLDGLPCRPCVCRVDRRTDLRA